MRAEQRKAQPEDCPQKPRLQFRIWNPEADKALYDAFRREAWYDIHGDEGVFDPEGYYCAAQKASQYDPRAVAVAMLWGEPAGMVQLDLERDAEEAVCFVPFVYMCPAQRHQGLGVQLLEQAERIARRYGRDRIRLRCAPTNAVAQRFYARNGFRKVGMAQDSRVPLELLEKPIGYEVLQR